VVADLRPGGDLLAGVSLDDPALFNPLGNTILDVDSKRTHIHGCRLQEYRRADRTRDGGGGTMSDGDAAAAALLNDLATLIDGDRDSHGDAVHQQQTAGTAWTWYLAAHGKLQAGEDITGADVARMMALLKMSRAAIGEYDLDHDRDLADYGAIAAACEADDGDADPDDLVRGEGR
jgi:hypothetical protein